MQNKGNRLRSVFADIINSLRFCGLLNNHYLLLPSLEFVFVCATNKAGYCVTSKISHDANASDF